MAKFAQALLEVTVCRFIPTHKHNLANEFRCFTNYKPYVLND